MHRMLHLGLVDPVPNPSPMSEEEGAWVREHAWSDYFRTLDRGYTWGFVRWSTCEKGTCWNCLAGRCEWCMDRQRGGPLVDDNKDWVHNQQGIGVAELILRPGGETCVWQCRCLCPKAGPPPAKKSPPRPSAPAAPSAPAPAPAPQTEAPAVQPDDLLLF
ncbi:DUF6248 family natural product biosynthesis protein [Streptomyces sp. NPDC096080]|uniref:DUF6248 family natural product biosynthesis protein n=1 Tax=Streptomyces sp. NPDC096080 TaxID=3156693 RepID=UPI003330E351